MPTPQADVSIDSYKANFTGLLSFVKLDSLGHMALAFQIRVPGYNYDLAHAGKGPSHGWMFFTSYNSEQANTLLEKNASQNDKDFIAAVNWKRAEECVAGGEGQGMSRRGTPTTGSTTSRWSPSPRCGREARCSGPSDCEGSSTTCPLPSRRTAPMWIPRGEFIVGGGKLATVIPVHSFTKMQKAIADKAFDGDVNGIPILKYDAVMVGEVQNPGLGPLHTEFDGKGYAYTSVFLSSEIVKWSLATFTVVDRIPTYYSIGHLMIPGGDSRKPWGKYVLALNKITKDRYLPTGPELTQSAQLYSIDGDKMQLLLDFPTTGEPHYAQAIPASLILDKQIRTVQPGREQGSVRHPEREGREGGAQRARGPRVDDGHPQPLHARQHRGHPAGRHACSSTSRTWSRTGTCRTASR